MIRYLNTHYPWQRHPASMFYRACAILLFSSAALLGVQASSTPLPYDDRELPACEVQRQHADGAALVQVSLRDKDPTRLPLVEAQLEARLSAFPQPASAAQVSLELTDS